MEQPPYPNEHLEEQLHIGHHWQLKVANHFLERGHWVRVPKLKVRPSYEERRRFSDGGDLFVIVNGWEYRLEVKSIDRYFTNYPETWPFKLCFLDTDKEMRRKGYVTAYIQISQQTEGMLVVPMSVQDRFVQTSFPDRRRPGITYTKWACPKDAIRRFDELVRWMETRKRRENLCLSRNNTADWAR